LIPQYTKYIVKNQEFKEIFAGVLPKTARSGWITVFDKGDITYLRQFFKALNPEILMVGTSIAWLDIGAVIS
jgi:hypothetical protein